MKPYVICHMMPSLDGRLRTERWKVPAAGHEEYDKKADTYRADAWLCGRVTMAEFADGPWRSRGRWAMAGPASPPCSMRTEPLPATPWGACGSSR